MLLDEDPATLLHTTIKNFNIQPDKVAIARINESLSALQTARDLRVREAESALKKLSRTQASLTSHHADLLSAHSPTHHSSTLSNLDTQKFRIAKSTNDLEIESERLSSQLLDLQSRLSELEAQGPEGGENLKRGLVDDEITLKLKVFRGLGMEVERDEKGEYSRVVVRRGTGGMSVLEMNGKFSRFFNANYLWSTL